jgi:hypothetical protein
MYKSVIDAQVQYKATMRQKDLAAKEQEALSQYRSLNDYEQFKSSQKTLNRLTKNSLFQAYTDQINSKQKKIQENLTREKQFDQKMLSLNQLAIENSKTLENLRKTQRISAYQDFLDEKYYENLKKQEEKSKEKLKEAQNLHESIESFYKNQEDYYNTLARIEHRQQVNQKSYKPVQQSENLRNRSRSEVILKWEEEAEQKKLALEAVENEKRKKMLRSETHALLAQMNEKVMKKDWEKSQMVLEKQSSDLNILRNNLQNDHSRSFNQEFKENYKKCLIDQIGQKEDERFRENLLNEREKIVNQDVLIKSTTGQDLDFKAIPGLHRSQSVARPWSRASNESESDLQNSMKILKKNPFHSENYSSLSLDLKKHDPIVNPIGFSFDSNRSFRRGRGLATLT